MQTERSFLHNIYLFKEMNNHELDSIAAIGHVRAVAAGDTIFLTGEKATALYLVMHGMVKIQRTTKEGDTYDVSLLEAGSHFGEMAFMDHAERTATAMASERGELMEISYSALAGVMEKHPTIATKFYRAMAHYLTVRLRLTTSDLTYMRERTLTHF